MKHRYRRPTRSDQAAFRKLLNNNDSQFPFDYMLITSNFCIPHNIEAVLTSTENGRTDGHCKKSAREDQSRKTEALPSPPFGEFWFVFFKLTKIIHIKTLKSKNL